MFIIYSKFYFLFIELKKPRRSSPRDKELLSARSQIENAPFIKSDRELHAPLFRNISTFKR